MLQLMRKHHKVAMLVVAVIVIISFAFFGPGGNEHLSGHYSREINGQRYTETDLQAAQNIAALAQQTTSFGDAPAKLFGLFMAARGIGRSNTEESGYENNLINLITIREEAKRLGITVTDEDIQKAVQALPRMQTDGKFDRSKLDNLIKFSQNPEATQRNFFTMMKDALLLEKLSALVGGTMQATDYAVTLDYVNAHAKTTLQTVIIPRKEVESVTATDEDAQKYYDANKDKKVAELDPVMKSEASREVRYILLEKAKREDISKEPADKQEEKKKAWDAQDKKVAATAKVISDALVEEGAPQKLEDAAALVKDKPEFLPAEIKPAVKITAGNPPEALKTEPEAVEAILEDGKGVAKLANGFIVFESGDLVEPALLSFEAAKPQLLEKLTKEKVAAALLDKANGVRSKLQETLAAGKPFTEALTAAGVTATSYSYSTKTPAKDAPPYFADIQALVKTLNPGSLAPNPIKAGDDMAVVFLEKYELPDDPKMADDKKQLKRTQGYNDSPFAPSPVFMSWFNQRRDTIAPIFFGEAQ
jgi:peptidyl-prolyl cis-trans isomerase D